MRYKVTYGDNFQVMVTADSEQEAIKEALASCEWEIVSALEEEYFEIERDD